MRVLALSAVLLAFPALAHHHDDADPNDTPAVLDRVDVADQLAALQDSLGEAMARARGRPAVLQSLRRARAELDRLAEQAREAPTPRDWWRSQGADAAYWNGGDAQDRRGDRDRDRDVNPVAPPPPPAAYGNAPPPAYGSNPPPAYAGNPPPPARVVVTPPPPVAQPMRGPEFNNLMAALAREPFPQNRLMVLNQAASSQFFLTSQVRALMERFEFPRDRLMAARTLKPHLLDRENAFQLYSLFEFPNDKAELQRILAP